ncbi:MAG: hypothetical protein HUK05_01930 [Prevotella sp.]|nr:hypothetical protein [Prevotella sp.]MCF0209348.1 hypothetical protein [Bacteroidaceae bacterium]
MNEQNNIEVEQLIDEQLRHMEQISAAMSARSKQNKPVGLMSKLAAWWKNKYNN